MTSSLEWNSRNRVHISQNNRKSQFRDNKIEDPSLAIYKVMNGLVI